MEEAHPDRVSVSDRTIDSHVKRIRRKFESLDRSFGAIEALPTDPREARGSISEFRGPTAAALRPGKRRLRRKRYYTKKRCNGVIDSFAAPNR